MISLLVSQVVFAELWNRNEIDFVNAFKQSDLQLMENSLRTKTSSTDLSALLYTVLNNYSYTRSPDMQFNSDNRLALLVIRLLINYGVDIDRKASYCYAPYNDDIGYKGNLLNYISEPLMVIVDDWRSTNMQTRIAVFRLLLESGADMYGFSWGILFLILNQNGVEADDNIEFSRALIENGYNVNRMQGSGRPLTFAVLRGAIAHVRLFVEAGAMVNEPDSGGRTAAQQAYEDNKIDIYNYLKQNGATWSPPTQVASNPAPSSSNSYTPPQPSYSPSPQPSSPNTPSRNTGREVVDAINRAFEAPIQNGTYRMSGRAEEIVFAGIARSGNVFYKDAAGTSHRGTYSIDGNIITINVMNNYYFYNVTSNTSFSGHGQTWRRVGF